MEILALSLPRIYSVMTMNCHRLIMDVRDYELDLQGIVNNSVYLNYFEHARHRCIKELGIDFHELHLNGVDPVVVRIEIDYRSSLSSSQSFEVQTSMEAHGKLRYLFHQSIHRLPDMELCARATVTAAILVHGRPAPYPAILEAWEHWTNRQS